MRVVAVLPHFAPDVAPTGTIGTRLVSELGSLGVHIDVVTALPWYADHRVAAGWGGAWRRRETTPWGSVQRLHPFPTGDKRNIAKRAVGFAAFCAAAAAVGAAGPRADAVLAMTPPLPMAATGFLVAAARRAPLVLNVQDVFPDVAVELGVLRGRAPIAAASWLERWSYARASAVTVLSQDMHDNLAEKTDPARLHIIGNFADVDAIRPGERDNDYRSEFGLGDRTVVMYAGNVGMSQSLDLLVDAARALQHRGDVVFVVNGAGSSLAELRQRATGLTNVVFVPMQPMDRLPQVLAAGDLHVVPLKTGLARSSVPSKTYSILGAGRPVLASVDVGSEVQRIVEAAGAGTAVEPDDPARFLRALTALLADPVALRSKGAAGRAWMEQEVTPAGVARRYADLFEEVALRHRRREPRR